MNKTKNISNSTNAISNNIIQLRQYGTVNIDNILDKDFELIQDILKNTIEKKIQWQPGVFITIFRTIILKQPFESFFSAKYKEYNITLNNNHKGIITIIITKGLSKKRILKTFIPFKPVIKNNYRIGTYRSTVLCNLFNIVKSQTNILVAVS